MLFKTVNSVLNKIETLFLATLSQRYDANVQAAAFFFFLFMVTGVHV